MQQRGAYLIVLAALAGVWTGCERSGEQGSAPGSQQAAGRVNAVTSGPARSGKDKAAGADAEMAGFCDIHAQADKAATFQLPPLAPGQASPPASSRWRWVNVWATWCKPCVEELPLLSSWQAKLRADKREVDFLFVSIDEGDEEITRFAAKHPGTPPSVRVADPANVPAWLTSIGLDEGASIPIHLFVDPDGRIRCARVGTVDASHYPVVRRIFEMP